MKKLYLAGIALEKDLEFCEILKDLENTNGVYITATPEPCEVVEMRYTNGYNNDREETGKTHIGYYYHYVNFIYRGYMFHINASSYYPFTDDNNPGMWNFMLFALTSPISSKQATYDFAYNGIKSIDELLNKHDNFRPLKDVYEKSHTWHVNRGTVDTVKNITTLKGGYRELAVFNKPHFIVETGTWNNDHKVVNIVALEPDEDGHRDSYSIDLITREICG